MCLSVFVANRVVQTAVWKMHSWQWKFNILYLGHERNSEQLASYQLTGPGQLQFISAVNQSDIFFFCDTSQCNRTPPVVCVGYTELELICCSSRSRTAVVLVIESQKIHLLPVVNLHHHLEAAVNHWVTSLFRPTCVFLQGQWELGDTYGKRVKNIREMG